MPLEQFLDCFPGRITYCALDDKKINHHPVHLHEGYEKTRAEMLVELEHLNSQGFGIFFAINEIDRRLDPTKQRTSAMLVKTRAIWADDDNPRSTPRADWPLAPNIVVQTSNGKYHYYWLTTTEDIVEWGQVMNGIANAYDCDVNAKDIVRVLRLPNFLHCKGDPVLVESTINSTDPYNWDTITQAFPPDLNAPTRQRYFTTNVGETHAAFSGYAEAVQAIHSGTNFHGAIMWLLNHWANCGLRDPSEMAMLIMSQMNLSTVQDERWEARTSADYITANVRDAIHFVETHPEHEDMVVPVVDGNEHQLDIPMPPGRMGELCKEIYEMAPHPNEEVALMAGFALVAGVVGRQYNVLGTGLNLYVTLLADSGIGKANLKDSINLVLMKNTVLQGGSMFKGASRFTGPRAVFKMLEAGPCRVSVLEEAGLLGETKAGDMSGLNRVMLDIYTSSGADQFSGGEQYSDKQNDIPVVASPALTIAQVSTPTSYLRVLKDKNSAESGDLARSWTMRSIRDKKHLNANRRTNFSDEIQAILSVLVQRCTASQQPTFEVTNVETGMIDIESDSAYWVDYENRMRREDKPLKRTLASRAFIKTIKIAAVASVFNGLTTIGKDEYKWAKEAIEGEIDTIEGTIQRGTSDDLELTFTGIVVPVISKIINKEYKTSHKTQKADTALSKKGMFSRYNLTQALKNSTPVKRMDDDTERASNPKSGIEKMVTYMLKNGYVEKVEVEVLREMNVRTKVAYVVTDDFLRIANGS